MCLGLWIFKSQSCDFVWLSGLRVIDWKGSCILETFWGPSEFWLVTQCLSKYSYSLYLNMFFPHPQHCQRRKGNLILFWLPIWPPLIWIEPLKFLRWEVGKVILDSQIGFAASWWVCHICYALKQLVFVFTFKPVLTENAVWSGQYMRVSCSVVSNSFQVHGL